MLSLLLAAQVTSCHPDYIGGYRCSAPLPLPVMPAPAHPTPYVDQDWGAIFQRIRDRHRAADIGRLLAAGDCAGAERYAAQRGDLATALQIRNYCQSVPAQAPVFVRPESADGPRKVRAKTPSGFCLDVPPGYVGTGAENTPAVTSAMPRCSALRG